MTATALYHNVIPSQSKTKGPASPQPSAQTEPQPPLPGEGTGGRQGLPQGLPGPAIPAPVGVDPESPAFSAVLLARDGKCPQPWLRELRVPDKLGRRAFQGKEFSQAGEGVGSRVDPGSR